MIGKSPAVRVVLPLDLVLVYDGRRVGHIKQKDARGEYVVDTEDVSITIFMFDLLIKRDSAYIETYPLNAHIHCNGKS